MGDRHGTSDATIPTAGPAAAATPFDIAQWMSAPAIAAYDALIAHRTYAAGQTVYTQDERGSELYRIDSGLVRLVSRQPDGREAVFLLFGAGDCFGVSSLVDGGPRPQTAECLSPVKMEVLGAGGYAVLRRDHPTFTDAVLRLLAQQMRVVSSHYAQASVTSLASRIATRIIELAIAREDADGGIMLSVDLPQSELAALAGASRQSVNKILQAFQQDGVIGLARRVIIVCDLQALRRMTHFG